MSSIKRRHFLQFAGSTLSAITLSQSKSIADITNPGGRTPVNIEGEQALGWVQELLGDLERNTRSIRVESSGNRIVAKSQLAVISTIINVVES